ncbi:AAA family ATPase [Epilithonimonas xixisoli]|uniref:AAA ATPase-like protein n=1 Tax=Epilithonimonas xixisoli TaxID=1476462 RepID=A0A4R8I988_9FLAO|nr:AAA family ATPase [Epilithonimonas xixisoli]TDX86652.1 AAA ATPase-like protein [Epilithonimonas xixisoli]
MYKIRKVKVTGFWNKFSIETNLDENVNIFIGRNGTGKTTFINLIEAALSVNLENLVSTKFDELVIHLQQGKSNRKITISKIEHNLQYKELQYKIGTNVFRIPILSTRELRSLNSGRVHPKYLREKFSIKDSLEPLVNLTYLSVSREKIFNDSIEERNSSEIYNAIDNRLEQLISDLTVYQLELETEVSKLSKKFQEDVLKIMLFDENLDYIDITKHIEINLEEIRLGLSKAYSVLGILDSTTEQKIEIHTEELKKSVEKINSSLKSEKNTPIFPNDVTPLTLVKRTKKIIDLSSKLEDDKKKVFFRVDNYINLLNKFHSNKYFSLQGSKKGAIGIFSDNQSRIDYSDLSSGEKQLLILLTETLLQKENNSIFIADEPELSLHIEWQRMIITSIRDLNPNSQIILATHSPEIVGRNFSSVINMEKIING